MSIAIIVFVSLAVALFATFALFEPRFRARNEARRDQRLRVRGHATTFELLSRHYATSPVSARAVKLVRDCIAKAAHIPDPEWILPTDRLIGDLDPWGFDRLGTVELIMALEDALGIEIPNHDVTRLVTVDDLIKYVSTRSAPPSVPSTPGDIASHAS